LLWRTVRGCESFAHRSVDDEDGCVERAWSRLAGVHKCRRRDRSGRDGGSVRAVSG
jgi:hypothetical protein